MRVLGVEGRDLARVVVLLEQRVWSIEERAERTTTRAIGIPRRVSVGSLVADIAPPSGSGNGGPGSAAAGVEGRTVRLVPRGTGLMT